MEEGEVGTRISPVVVVEVVVSGLITMIGAVMVIVVGDMVEVVLEGGTDRVVHHHDGDHLIMAEEDLPAFRDQGQGHLCQGGGDLIREAFRGVEV